MIVNLLFKFLLIKLEEHGSRSVCSPLQGWGMAGGGILLFQKMQKFANQ